MTSRNEIEQTIRNAYAARCAGDLEGVMACMAPGATFQIHGKGTGTVALASPSVGADAVRPVMSALIQTYRFEDWKEVALLVDGERAALHWRGKVTHTGSGKSAYFDVFDMYVFKDGKVAELCQSFDTALAMSLYAAAAA